MYLCRETSFRNATRSNIPKSDTHPSDQYRLVEKTDFIYPHAEIMLQMH